MVTISNVKKSLTNEGKEIISFVIESGIELVQSQASGKFYAKGKKALLNTTLSEQAANEMIGSKLPGSIIRIPCDEYEYTIKDTGETIILNHSYTYSPEESEVTITKNEDFKTTHLRAEAIA